MSLIISLIESAQDHYPWVLLIVFCLPSLNPAHWSRWQSRHLRPAAAGNIRFRQPRTFPVNGSSASLGAIGGFWLSWRLGIRYRHRLTIYAG